MFIFLFKRYFLNSDFRKWLKPTSNSILKRDFEWFEEINSRNIVLWNNEIRGYKNPLSDSSTQKDVVPRLNKS